MFRSLLNPRSALQLGRTVSSRPAALVLLRSASRCSSATPTVGASFSLPRFAGRPISSSLLATSFGVSPPSPRTCASSYHSSVPSLQTKGSSSGRSRTTAKKAASQQPANTAQRSPVPQPEMSPQQQQAASAASDATTGSTFTAPPPLAAEAPLSVAEPIPDPLEERFGSRTTLLKFLGLDTARTRNMAKAEKLYASVARQVAACVKVGAQLSTASPTASSVSSTATSASEFENLPSSELFGRVLTGERQDSFDAWFGVALLHMWLVLVPLRTDLKYGAQISQLFLEDVERRMYSKLEEQPGSSMLLAKYMKQYIDYYSGGIVSFDEGLYAQEDSLLADAIWRNACQMNEDIAPSELLAMVAFVYRQLAHMHQSTRLSHIVDRGALSWV
eukprot:CAMPEP_0177683146 /NCGR_PEP_ID=MMETSP0447-20121125/31633_1 /TAXON_ID=0 /ORGANISM="Stygamoeba regulata, Strain BSH-02190019" /LENGTH=388 /DNA_ID=CAMNT_0019192689 /DNA_START=85 /DNA_END=1252 /DNA_ORIENTATION=-